MSVAFDLVVMVCAAWFLFRWTLVDERIARALERIADALEGEK